MLSYDIALDGDTDHQQQEGKGKGDVDAASRQQVVSEFGHVMLQNLRSGKLDIPGAKTSTLPAMHAERLQNAFPDSDSSAAISSGVKSLKRVWEELPAQERDRLSRIEGLDEVEELELLLSHYCIAHAERVRKAT